MALIAAQILAHLRNHECATYISIAKKLVRPSEGIEKAMRKLKEARMVECIVRRIDCKSEKEWRITQKGRYADPVNPLGSQSKRYVMNAKSKAFSEKQWRLREMDAQAAKLKRDTSAKAVNDGQIEPLVCESTKAGQALTEAPKFFSAMPPGVYVLEPSSCAARAAA